MTTTKPFATRIAGLVQQGVFSIHPGG